MYFACPIKICTKLKTDKRAAKFEEKMHWREEILTECWREQKNTRRRRRERNTVRETGMYASEEVERPRAKGRWMNVELSERDKDTDKPERRVTQEVWEVYDRGNSGVPGERVQKEEKWWRDLDVGTRREKTDIGRKKRKEGADCARRRERQLSTCGMDVSKWERGRERNGEKYRMKTEGK
jgi:hypothetical protein